MRTHCYGLLILHVMLFGLVDVSLGQVTKSPTKKNASFLIGKSGRPITLPVELHGRTVLFLLDTGSAKTCFDISLKSEMGSFVRAERVSTPAGLQVAEFFECPDSRLGDFPLRSVETVGCIELAPIRYATGLGIYGILGADFCKGKVLKIDFDKGSITFADMPEKEPPDEKDGFLHLPISIINGVPQIPIELPGGMEEKIVLDTGANRTTLKTDLFNKLAEQREIATTASHRAIALGGIQQSRAGKLSSMKLHTTRLENVILDGSDLSLLGLDQLSRFQLRIDLQRNQLSLLKGRGFAKPSSNATSGMSIIQDRGEKIIVRVQENGAASTSGIVVGDRITKINGMAATSIDMFELREILTHDPEKVVHLELERNQRLRIVDLTLVAVKFD